MSVSTALHDASIGAPPLQRCKKCSEPIVEGHAYELGDDRWHINCFKCSKCASSLGCNSNFLILGNGNLICSNCSYNCKQCGKKIDDLAILTGDQAYCSNCFKCRSCKQKIEDLRYARTSKGLFCMNCHERLMAKKRKYDLKKKHLAAKESLHEKQNTHKLIPHEKDAPQTFAREPLVSQDSLVSERERSSGLSSHDRLQSSQSAFFKDARTGSTDFTFNVKPHMEARPDTRLEDEVPLRQPVPQTASTSRSDFYELYNRSSSTTPKFDEDTARRQALSASADKLLPMPPSQAANTPDSETTSKSIPTLESKDNKENIMPNSKINVSQEFSIEEINDSDDELNKRNKVAHRTKTPPLSSIPFLSPETPQLINELQPAAQLKPAARAASPASLSHTTFQGKNVMILSPSQDDNAPAKSPDSLDRNTLFVEREARTKSACSSPLAKANRHARVLETDVPIDDLTDDEQTAAQGFHGRREDDADTQTVTTPEKNSEFSTPRKQAPAQRVVSSPPPRFPLPSIPTPKQNHYSPLTPHRDNESDFEHGLGLEGIEYYDYDELTRTAAKAPKPQKIISESTPMVTKLDEDEGSPALTRDAGLSRKQSLMRTPILNMRHKRSTSGGSNSGIGRLNIFRSKEDRQPPHSHSRNVSEGSIKSNGSAFVTPPLPFNNHNRSSSDTQYSSRTLDFINLTTEYDVKGMKLEVYQLEAKKTVLNNDVKKLNAEKQKLADELEALRVKVREETSKHDELVKANKQLKTTVENELETKMDQLAVKDDVVPQVIHHSNSSLGINSNTLSTSINSGSTEEEGVETHKATRLKFWKRAKLGFNQQPNLISTPTPTSKDDDDPKKSFGLISRSRSNNIIDTLLNGNGAVDDEAPLFQSSIQKRSLYENATVPMIVSRCLQEVEARGLDMEGIYRISGGNATIIAIEQAFASVDPKVKDERQLAKLDEALDCDINAVTSALKRYLRKIPDPLIPFAVYTDFIRLNTISNEERRAHEFKTKIIDSLPASNREVLHTLCKHLELINSYSHVNRMTYRNLSVVFAPTIARDETGEREMVDMGHRNDVTEFLFSNYTKIM